MIELFLIKLIINGLSIDYLPEMKTLVLLRHAKSSWEFSLDDFDRPLKLEGIDRIKRVSIEDESIFKQTDIVMTSPAIRALHTANILVREIGLEFDKVLINKGLYTFSSKSVENVLRKMPDKFDYVIFVGHNPAFTEIINTMTNSKINNLPTSSWAKIVFNEDKWSEVVNCKVSFSKSVN